MRRKRVRIKKKKKKILKFPIISRRAKITQQMLGHHYLVHNGKNYITVLATTPRLNTAFGNYAFTRRTCIHKDKKKDKKKKNK